MMLFLCFQSCCLLMKKKKKMKRIALLIDGTVFPLFSSRHRSSAVSVVFDSNAILSDVAPVYPILLPDQRRIKKKLFTDVRLLCVFFCLHDPD